MQTKRKSRGKAKSKFHTHKCSCFSCLPATSPRLTMMGQWDCALCCLPLTPCCPETDGSQSLPHRRALSARESGGTAWVESWRLILDLETPCQQLWLGSSWAGPSVGRSESPCREPWTRPSRSALMGTFLPLCLSGKESLGRGSSAPRVGLRSHPFLQGLISLSCIEIFLPSISAQVAL